MIAFNDFAADWIEVLWRATWQGGLVIAIIAAICFGVRRMPAQFRAWLWWLAGIQLLVRLLLAIPIVVSVPAPAVPVSATPDGADSGVPLSIVQSIPTVTPPDWRVALVALWALGGLFVLALGIRRLFRARKLVLNARPVSHPTSLRALEVYWGAKPGIPRLLESDAAPCPMLIGWLNPTIVLPSKYAEQNSPTEVRMAIAHEVTHVRRRHHAFGMVEFLTQVAFYYHPLSWLACQEAALAREEVCDLEVLRLTGQSPSSYARLLLKSVQSGAPVAALGVAFGYRDLRRRINMLTTPSTSRFAAHRRGWTTLVVLIALASLPWQIVAQTKHSPTVPVVPKKTHAKHVVRRRHTSKKVVERDEVVYVVSDNGKVITSEKGANGVVRIVYRTSVDPQSTTSQVYRTSVDPQSTVGPNSKQVVVRVFHDLRQPVADGGVGGVLPSELGPIRIESAQVPAPPNTTYRVTADKNGSVSYTVVSSGGKTIVRSVGVPQSSRVGTGAYQVIPDHASGLTKVTPDQALGSGTFQIVPDTFRALPDQRARQAGLTSVDAISRVRLDGVNEVTLNDRSEQTHSLASHVSVVFDGMGANAALLKLLRLSGGDYMFRAEVPSRKVTCKLTNVTVEKALQSILDSLDLHMRVANGTTYIEH